MRNRWYHRPVLHTATSGVVKRVGWLEFFYDLVFVAAFIQLGNGLAQHVGFAGYAGFAAVFAALWGAWTGFTFYANRFTVDDLTHRLLVLFQMFAVEAMAITAPEVLDGRPHRFALAYGVAQAVVAALYVRTFRHPAEARAFSRYWGGVFGVGAALWLGSAAVPAPWCYGLWAVGGLVLLGSPFARQSRAVAERHPLDQEHLSRRYGLLTLIVLGESFVQVLAGLSDDRAFHLGHAALTLLITCALWWTYFDDVAGARMKAVPLAFPLWLLAHLPLQLGLTATGVALKAAPFWDPEVTVSGPYRWLLCASLALVLFSTAVVDSVTERGQAELNDRARANVRGATAVIVLLLAPVGATMGAGMFLGVVTAICIVQVAFDLMMAPLDTHDLSAQMTTTADLARERARDAAKPAFRPEERIDAVVRKGTPAELRRDFYFFLMEGSLGRLFLLLAFLFVIINLVFASLYLLRPGCIAGARPDSFADAFFFSVQTMATIGYGVLNPATAYGNAVATVEAAVGLMTVALATGLMFAKVSRPRSSVLFSRTVIVTRLNGKPILMFRAGNARGNDIVDASVSVTVLKDEISPEGHHLRRMHDLKLMRERSPYFRLSWAVMHPLDDESPLKDVDWSDPGKSIISLVAIILGHDGTYGQTIYARHSWYPEAILAGHRFVDVIGRLPDGRTIVDYARFHDTVPEN